MKLKTSIILSTTAMALSTPVFANPVWDLYAGATVGAGAQTVFADDHDATNAAQSFGAMFGVDSDYEFIVVSHNYIFYYQDEDVIYIVNIYDDREDFMYKLFGIRTTSEETDQ